MYCSRHFRIRRHSGFSPDLFDQIRRGYEGWRQFVTGRIKEWPSSGIAETPIPSYVFGEPMLSADGTTITIQIDGEPGSYGALKLFEDGVPTEIYGELPLEIVNTLEESYENSAIGIRGDDWSPVME